MRHVGRGNWIRLSGSVVLCLLLGPVASYTQSAGASPSFAVTTIKPSRSPGWSLYFTENGLVGRGVSLQQLVVEAYAAYLPGSVAGGPSWMGKQTFDVAGKLDTDDLPRYRELTLPERRLMLQRLLKERFKLVVHREPKQVPAFALEVGSRGILAQPAKEALPEGIAEYEGLIRVSRPGHLEAFDFQCAGIATILQGTLGRMVVDRTGLKERFHFILHWSPDAPSEANTTDDAAWPPLPKALQEQLGLFLVSTTAPMEVIVIDHAETPSDN